jgi:hypothetical protein
VGGMMVSPSNMSINSNTSKLGNLFKKKRTATTSSHFTVVDFDRPRAPADPNSLGSILCEYSMVLPCAHPFGKLDMGYPLTLSKKEYGKVNVSMSMMFDAPYSPIAEVPKGMHSNNDYLNFYLLTPGGLVQLFN